MTNPTYIAPGDRTFEREGALSFDESVVASSGTISAKAGHVLGCISGTWKAYAVGTDVTAQTNLKAIGILLEDADLTTTASTVRVLEVGKVWEAFVRDAGITSSVTSFAALQLAPGKLVFANEEVTA